ncbi:VCBS domain-containing protein [Chlorobium phaeovibrioides]|uniref:VCBS domain-containing protein n=1 Tax=Chlorobium phaeovibrioides TaxID=1094 RepID=UPI001C8C048D|nr:VCBS domain-containing protein [Chlorobium phaeovibrioides]
MSITVTDGDGGTTGAQSAVVNVTAVNDVPTNTVGTSSFTVNEDTSLSITGLTVADVDETGNLSVELTASHGTVTILADVEGGLASSGISNNGSGAVTLSGTAAAINATLAATGGVSYKGTLNYNGSDALTIKTTDSGTAYDSDSVSITVNSVDDTATIEGNTSGSGAEDGGAITGTLTATDAADGLTDGAYFSVSGAASHGTATINASTGAWSYTPTANYNGSDSFTVTVTDDDGFAKTQQISLTVTPVADTVSVTNASTDEDTQTASGLVISRNAADGSETGYFKITAISGGTLYKNDGTTAINNGTFITYAEGNAGLKFTPSANSTSSGTFQVQGSTTNADAGLGGSVATATITVAAVNDAPVNTVGASSITVNEDTAVSITGLSVSDVDEAGNISVQLSVSHGAITVADNVAGGLAAGGLSANGSGSVTLTGTPAAINATLAGTDALSYRGDLNYNGPDTLTLKTTDSGSLNDTDTVSITVSAVNDTPGITAGGTTAFTEQTPTSAAPGITISDPEGDGEWDGGTLTVQVTSNSETGDSLSLTTANNSGIWLVGINSNTLMSNTTAIGTASASSAAGGAAWTFTFNANATSALVQATARAVQFNNSSDTPGTASRTVTFTAADSHNASATTTQTVTVTALNDAPRLANTADPALSFTASSLSYAEFPDVDDSITTAFTLETWVKFDSLDGVQFISGQAVEQMELHTNGAVLRFIPTGGAYFDTGDVLVVGQWTHIAATYDASTDTAHIYINGVEVSCTDNNHDTDAVLKSTGSYYELARRGDNSFYMNGDIAEFRIWNDVRTAAEVSGSMNGALQGTEAGLVALWKLDEGSGTTLADATANKFNGTAYNTTTWDTRSVTGGLSVAFTEDGSPVHPFSGVILGTVETGQSIIALTLTVSNVSDTTESLGIDGSTIALTNGASGTTATNGVGYSVSVSSGTATVTMSKAEGISASDAGTLINGISYSNSSQAPSTGATRTVTITSLKDSGGSAGGGSDTASLNVAATVSVHAVNDAPVLAAQTLSITETASYDTFSIEKGRFGATDAEGDSIVFSLVDSTTVPSGAVDSEGYDFVQNGAYGDLYIQTDGDYAFVPDNGAINALTNNVSESFKIRATAGGQTAESTFTVSITAVNDTPTITTYVSTADITTGLPDTAYSVVGSSPDTEVVKYAFDDNVNTKYLNFSGVGSSVTVDAGANYVVTSLGLTTANDALNRDPAHFILYGSTDNASFTQIAAAALTPPAERYTDYPTVSFSNSTSYRYYRLAFDQSTGGGGDSYIQVAEIRLGGETSNVILYTENAQVNALENVILRDNEHGGLASATVTISGNYENASDSLSFTNNNTGLYGSITASFVSSTGVLSLSGSATVEQYQNALRAVTYASSSDNPTLNSPTRTLSWQVNDGAADSSVATSTITITPVNDAPALAGAGNTLAFTEGSSPAVIEASLALSDADDTTIASAAVTISGGYVSTEDVLACTSQNGITSSWNGSAGVLTLTGSATIAQYKAALESITYQNTNTDNPNIGNRTISWVVNDAALGSSPVTSTITVAGVNDAPTVSSSITGSASEGASSITFNLLADASDVDDSSLNITGVTYTVGGVSTGNSGVDVPAGFSLSGVTLTVDPAAAAFDDLADGADRTIVASYTIADGSGGSVTQTATVSITGTNDVPVVTSAAAAHAGAVVEAGHQDNGTVVAGTATATGTLVASDVDTGATKTWSLQGTPSETYGTMAIDSASGVWTYTLDNTKTATQALKEGESATQSYTARVTDDQGASVDQTLTVTITGTNDVPVLQAVTAGSITETVQSSATTDQHLSGTLTAADVDGGDSKTYGINDGSGNAIAASDGVVSKAGTYGTLTLDTSTGVYAYTKNASAIEALDDDESGSDSFTVVVTDSAGAVSSKTYTVSVTGHDDAPTLSAVTSGSITETDRATAVTETGLTGTLSGSDVDTEILTYGIDGGIDLTGVHTGIVTKTGTYGTLSLNRSSGAYQYDRTAASVEALAASESVSDVFTLTVTDGDGSLVTQTFTVNLTGADDAPSITVVDIDGSITEASTLLDSGSVTFTDVDLSDRPVATGAKSSIIAVKSDGTTALVLSALQESALAAGFSVTNADGNTNNGTVNWEYVIAESALDFLGAGEKVTAMFTITVNDQHGGTATQDVMVGITGANDSPSISLGGSDSASEGLSESNTGLSKSGTLTLSDKDATDTVTPSVSAVTHEGSANGITNSDLKAMLTVDSGVVIASGATHGTIHWAFNSGSEAFNYLAADETLKLTYTLRATDSQSSAVDQAVVITITGTNDTPVVDATDVSGSVIELVTASGNLTDSGTIGFTDTDLSDTHSLGAVTASGGALGALTVTKTTDTTSGINGVVSWEYSVAASEVEYLAAGETKVENFSFEVQDSHGGSVTRTVEVTLTGTNDAPVITAGPDTASLSETDAGLSTSGSLTVSDADVTDVVTATRTLSVGGTSNRSDSAAPSDAALLGMFTVTPGTIIDGSRTSSTLGWSFDSGTGTFDYLQKGETLVLTYTVSATDDNGTALSDSETVTITITGTNDTPVITNGNDTSALTETDAALTASGTMAVMDLDTADTVDIAVESVSAGGTFGGTVPLTNAELKAMLGVSVQSGSISALGADASAGTEFGWTFTSGSSGSAAFDFLRDGETLVLTYTLKATDNSGAGSLEASPSATSSVVVTVTGTNDAPEITAATVTGAIAEGSGDLTETGSIAFSDVDLSDRPSVSKALKSLKWESASGSNFTDTMAIGRYNTLVGAFSIAAASGNLNGGSVGWEYSMQESTLDFLAAGETVTVVYTVRVADDKGGSASQDVTITINGTNDTPVAAATDLAGGAAESTGSPSVEAVLTDTGTILFSDIDLADSHSLSAVTASSGALGALTVTKTTDTTSGINGVVSWEYSVAASAVEYLAAGETKVENFSFEVQDSHGGSVTRTVEVTLTGTNDAPVITAGPDTASLSETDAGLSASGSLTVSDADVTDVVTATRTLSVGGTSNRSDSAAPGDAALLGMFTVTPGTIIDDSHTGSTLGWSFDSGTGKFDYLQKGETLVLTYTVSATDDDGTALSDSETVTITITGTNDTPVITNGNDTAALTETDAALTASGTMAVMDLDTADTVDIAVESVSRGGTFGGTVPLTNVELKAMLGVSVQSGSISALGADGAAGTEFGWTFTSGSSGSGAFDFLREGETLVLTYTLKATDNSGAGLQEASPSATSSVVVTVTGTNDAPSITEATVTGAITEGSGDLTETGSIAFADVDLADRPAVTKVLKSLKWESVSGADGRRELTDEMKVGQRNALVNAFEISERTGNSNNGAVDWLYSVSEADLDFLAEGERVTAIYTITVSDDRGGSASEDVMVTITGTNDAPTLSEVVSGSIIEDPSATTVKEAGLFGSLRGSDADNAPTLVYGIDGLAATGGTVTETGRYGTLRVNTESGVYLYQRNVIAVEALDEGQIVTDSFVFTVTDELSLQATSVFRVLLQGSGEFTPLIPLEKPSTVRPAENVSSILTDVPAVADQQPASDSGPPVVGSTALVIQGVDVSVDPFGDTGSSKQSLASSVQNAVVETVAFPESVQGPEQQRAESFTAQMDAKEESVIEVDMREKGAYRIPESIQSLSQSASSRIIYEASLLDGSPLPEGVRFDSLTQSFVVTGKLYGDIEIVVRARDGSGNETKTVYRLEFGSEDGESGNEQDGLQVEKLQGAAGRRLPDADIPFTRMGRAALSEQLAEAGRWGLFRQRHQLLAQLEALENPEAVDA